MKKSRIAVYTRSGCMIVFLAIGLIKRGEVSPVFVLVFVGSVMLIALGVRIWLKRKYKK